MVCAGLFLLWYPKGRSIPARFSGVRVREAAKALRVCKATKAPVGLWTGETVHEVERAHNCCVRSFGGALDRQRGRRSRAGASLLRPQRLGDRFCPSISAFYSLEISTSSTSSRVRPLLRQSTRARAVSMAVRQGMLSSTVLRRSFTLSSLGLRPLALVLMT